MQMKPLWPCLVCAFSVSQTAYAQRPSKQTPSPIVTSAAQSTSASALAEEAHILLKRGKNFSACAEKLQKAIEQDPENAQYHMDLGCALAGRAASVSYAAYSLPQLEQGKARYQKHLAVWNAAATDAKKNGTQSPPPPVPSSLVTADDGVPFSMTREVAVSEFTRLATRALSEWNRGVTLQNNKPAPEQAQAHYIRGYGLLLLRRYVVQYLGGGEALMKLLPARLEVIKEMEQATQIAPDTARYYQALGDAYGDGRSAKRQTENLAEAVSAYEKAALLKPTTSVYWRLYEIYHYSPDYPTGKAADALRKAVAYKSSNAFFWYRLADETLQKTKFSTRSVKSKKPDLTVTQSSQLSDAESSRLARAAVGYMERGNSALDYSQYSYEYAVPEEFSVPWYWISRNDDSNSVGLLETVTLSEATDAYAQSLANKGARAEGESVARAIIGMGGKMQSAVQLPSPEQDFPDAEANLLCLWAGMATANGYRVLVEIAEKGGDAAETTRIKEEQTSSRAYFKQCRAAFKTASDNYYGVN